MQWSKKVCTRLVRRKQIQEIFGEKDQDVWRERNEVGLRGYWLRELGWWHEHLLKDGLTQIIKLNIRLGGLQTRHALSRVRLQNALINLETSSSIMELQ